MKLRNIKRASQRSKLYSLLFLKKFLFTQDTSQELLFIDECSATNDFKSVKCWQHKNGTGVHYTPGRLESFSVIACIYNKNIISYSVKQGTNNSESFIEFIKLLEKKVLEDSQLSQKLRERKLTIVLDNARIHTSKLSLAFLKAGPFNVVYLPPYSPELNPIEKLWAYVKAHTRKYLYKTKYVFK